jgi:hypothetical protein
MCLCAFLGTSVANAKLIAMNGFCPSKCTSGPNVYMALFLKCLVAYWTVFVFVLYCFLRCVARSFSWTASNSTTSFYYSLRHGNQVNMREDKSSEFNMMLTRVAACGLLPASAVVDVIAPPSSSADRGAYTHTFITHQDCSDLCWRPWLYACVRQCAQRSSCSFAIQ